MFLTIKKMTLHKDSTNLDVAIIYHLCQEEKPQRQPQIPRKVEVETNFWRRQHSSHISNPFKSFFTLNFSCPETTMTDYYKDVVVNNHKLDDLSNYHYLLEHVNINIICTCEFFMSRNNND